jgi:hypothetical protein
MNTHTLRLGMLALTLAGFLLYPSALPAQSPSRVAANDDDIAVQTRGPIHEAFAQPVNTPLDAGPVAPRKPPAPIPEEPPDQKPEGDNVQWIPGYWNWDADRKDYIWVSGTWRNAPDSRKWVPGYWTQGEDGWQWVPGFWAPGGQEQLQYQEEPPATLDTGPDTPQPDQSSIYVPGCWVYRTSRYQWRPGFWMRPRVGFCWIPAHYCYTPSGCVFVDGYWDYPLERRGLLFAPVCFNRPLWTNPDWCYRPSYCVSYPALLGSLFVRPAYHHYFFGDYYGPAYRRLGFSPWFAYGRAHHDPLFGYYRWAHRRDAGWYRGLRDTYTGRVNGDLVRPPRTLVQQNRLIRSTNVRSTTVVKNVRTLQVVQPITRITNVNNVRLTRLNQTQVNRYRNTQRVYNRVGVSRQTLERSGRSLAGSRSTVSLAGLPAGRGTTRGGSRPVAPTHVSPSRTYGGSSTPRYTGGSRSTGREGSSTRSNPGTGRGTGTNYRPYSTPRYRPDNHPTRSTTGSSTYRGGEVRPPDRSYRSSRPTTPSTRSRPSTTYRPYSGSSSTYRPKGQPSRPTSPSYKGTTRRVTPPSSRKPTSSYRSPSRTGPSRPPSYKPRTQPSRPSASPSRPPSRPTYRPAPSSRPSSSKPPAPPRRGSSPGKGGGKDKKR